MNLHIAVPYGTNNHHIAEAIFKGVAKALRQAVGRDPRSDDACPQSSKGADDRRTNRRIRIVERVRQRSRRALMTHSRQRFHGGQAERELPVRQNRRDV